MNQQDRENEKFFTMIWPADEQPDFDVFNAAMTELGRPKIYRVKSNDDNCAAILANDGLTDEEAQELFDWATDWETCSECGEVALTVFDDEGNGFRNCPECGWDERADKI